MTTRERILPELLPGDLFATPPLDTISRFASDVMNSETFHWVLVVHPILIDSRVDYEIMEAIPSKGVAVGLLSQMYGDVPIRVYRVHAPSRPDERAVERAADSYGRSFYAFTTLPNILTWWLGFHLLRFIDSQPPALDLDSALCTGFVTMVWKDLGVDLVPQGIYPTPEILEKSPQLECIYQEY